MYHAVEQTCATFFSKPRAEARRIFHGRGQLHPGLEHLSIDWFPPVVLITSYEDIDDSKPLVEAVQAGDTQEQIQSILLQYRKQKGTPCECLYGEDTRHCVVMENGLKYEVQPGVHQNAGLFLDMRPLRRWLMDNASGKNVLNLFAYTCSLSVAALAGGARQVVSVDMSKPSIRWGERNHALNNQDSRQIRSVPHNLFKSWGRIKQFGRYDLVVIDPPSRQRGSFDVEKNYGAVLKKLSKLTAPGAQIIATVNSPYITDDFLIHQFQRYAPTCQFLEMMPRSPEFEDRFPERALKIYHFTSP
jgi:23S rRNA (cytosine1962-C5)-methyltransferase